LNNNTNDVKKIIYIPNTISIKVVKNMVKLIDNLKNKLTGQESVISGNMAGNLKRMIPGQQTTGTPVISKFIETKNKLPGVQSAQTGPVRKAFSKMMVQENVASPPPAEAKLFSTRDEAYATSGLFGDERMQDSPNAMGLGGIFGRDLGGMYGRDL
jgi:hypothetical protein